MFPLRKLATAVLPVGYANRADFCEVLERNTNQLYLLAFLLTANHKQAEQCFLSTVEEAFKEKAVFKNWALSWVKRSLIKCAIRTVEPATSARTEKRDFWNTAEGATPGDAEIDAVTQLAPLDRFVFVMSVLERYSAWECSLLLGCNARKVARARTRALAGLRGTGPHFPATDTRPLLPLQATA
jgi:DNA-directed RNA polymerase specialized sigma24 family protein